MLVPGDCQQMPAYCCLECLEHGWNSVRRRRARPRVAAYAESHQPFIG